MELFPEKEYLILTFICQRIANWDFSHAQSQQLSVEEKLMVTRLGTATCRNRNAGPTTNTLRSSKSFSSWSVCFLSCQLTAVRLNSYCFRVQRDVNLSITIGEWRPKWHQGAESSRDEKPSWKYKTVKALSTSFYQNSMLLVIRYVSIPACFS